MYNDTFGTFVQNSTLITVSNSQTNQSTILNASAQSYSANQAINWSCSDADNDLLTSTVYFAGGSFTTNDFNFTTNMTANGNYYLNVSCSDGISPGLNNSEWYITLNIPAPPAPSGGGSTSSGGSSGGGGGGSGNYVCSLNWKCD